MSHHDRQLASRSKLLVLGRQSTLPRQLLLGLLVAVRDELVEETAWLALVVAVTLGSFNLSLQVAGGFVVDIVFGLDFVKVGCWMSAPLVTKGIRRSSHGSCRASTASASASP